MHSIQAKDSNEKILELEQSDFSEALHEREILYF